MVASGEHHPIRIAELFAGIGGFRLGLEGCESWGVDGVGMQTVWANQWEPPGSPSKQFAWACYEARFGKGACVNEDIEKVLDRVALGAYKLPEFDLLAGGFPCQDYSVAKPSSQAEGIEGKKGVLWWQILRLLEMSKPRFVLLENVDRLLKSPSSQRGRDFAVILHGLNELGYSVEWRVIDASLYGFPQRRKRVFIYGEQARGLWDLEERLITGGVLARAFPAHIKDAAKKNVVITGSVYEISRSFGRGADDSKFYEAGVMQNGKVLMANIAPDYKGSFSVLGDVLLNADEVPESFYLDEGSYERWSYLKGSKREERICKRNGHSYIYSEGQMAFPDDINAPSRTVLTGEGGKSASRSKHVVASSDGRLRRLTPVELERLFGFPDGWTSGMTDRQRAFCLGNALVVGIVRRIGLEINQMVSESASMQ